MNQNVQYELHKLEKLVAANLSGASEPPSPGYRLTPKPAAIKKEIGRISESLVGKSLTFKDEGLLRRYIQFHHKGIIALMDAIYSKRRSEDSIEHYKDVEDLLSFLEKNFEKYADSDAKVPDNHISKFKSAIAGKLPIIKRKLGEGPADQRIIEVLLRPLTTFSTVKSDQPITYRELRYLRQLQKQLLNVVHKPEKGCTDDDLRRLMYYMNYNRRTSFDCLTAFITAETNKCETIGERIEKLSLLLKEVNQVPVQPDTSYRQNRPALKDQLSMYLTEEIEYLERIYKLPNKSHGDDQNTSNETKLKLEISVAQLGYLLRLLLDTQVIQNENIAELLRFAARSCTTKRSEAISVGSLRGKFYEVETATKGIIEATSSEYRGTYR